MSRLFAAGILSLASVIGYVVGFSIVTAPPAPTPTLVHELQRIAWCNRQTVRIVDSPECAGTREFDDEPTANIK